MLDGDHEGVLGGGFESSTAAREKCSDEWPMAVESPMAIVMGKWSAVQRLGLRLRSVR